MRGKQMNHVHIIMWLNAPQQASKLDTELGTNESQQIRSKVIKSKMFLTFATIVLI